MCRPCVRRGGLQDSGFVACFPSPPRRARLRYVVPGGTGAFVRVGVQRKDAKLGHPTASSQHKRTPPPRQRKAGWATLSCKLIRINELTGWATREVRAPGRPPPVLPALYLCLGAFAAWAAAACARSEEHTSELQS